MPRSLNVELQRRNLIGVLADEVRNVGMSGLIPLNIADQIASQIQDSSADIFVPEHVICRSVTRGGESRYHEDVHHFAYYCRRCGRYYEEKPPGNKCECGGKLVSAPVWFSIGRREGDILPVNTDNFIVPLSLPPHHASVRGRIRESRVEKVRIRNPGRPLSTLYINNKRAPLTANYRRIVYRLFFPSEGGTKPISITVFNYESGEDVRLYDSIKLPGVKRILFTRSLNVLQITPAYRAGHPMRRKNIIVISRDRDRFKIPARFLQTTGLVIEVDESELGISRASHREKWRAYHTLSHAFLSKLPIAAGLESRDFGESLLVSKKLIAVYDNAVGGLGGVEGTVERRGEALYLNPGYMSLVAGSPICPLDCNRACKACLFTDSCFMLNWDLDRRILLNAGWKYV